MEGSRYERVEWRIGNQGPLAIVSAVSSEGHTLGPRDTRPRVPIVPIVILRAKRHVWRVIGLSKEPRVADHLLRFLRQNRTYRKATPPCLVCTFTSNWTIESAANRARVGNANIPFSIRHLEKVRGTRFRRIGEKCSRVISQKGE